MSFLELALRYAGNGWPVFPCEPRGKQPLGLLVPHGLKDATIDEAMIRHWWTTEPQANIGLPTGIAFDVADLDTAAAMAHFLALAKKYGTDLSLYPRVETGKGGRHVYVAITGFGNRTGVFSGLDWRGKGGYVVAPGSVHPSGAIYAWKQEPNGASFPAAPNWLLAMLRKPETPRPRVATDDEPPESYVRAAVEAEIKELRATREGQRNDSLNRAAFSLGQMVGAGWLAHHLAEAELTAAAYAIGLEKREATATIRSGLESGAKEPRQMPAEGWVAAQGKLIIGPRTRGIQNDDGRPDKLRSVGNRDTTWYLNFPEFGEIELTTKQLRSWAEIEVAHMERFNCLPQWNPKRPQEAWRDLLRELLEEDAPREEGITTLRRADLIVQEIHRYCHTAAQDALIMLKRGHPVRSTEHGGYLIQAGELVHRLDQLVRPTPSLQEIHNLIREHLGGRSHRERLPDDANPTRLILIPLEAIEKGDD